MKDRIEIDGIKYVREALTKAPDEKTYPFKWEKSTARSRVRDCYTVPVPHSWIVEKAQELGMEFKDDRRKVNNVKKLHIVNSENQ